MGWDYEQAERLGDTWDDHYCPECGRRYVSSVAACRCEDEDER